MMDRRNIDIDFIENNCSKEKIDKYLDMIVNGELDGIEITNLPSGKFEEMYDVDDIEDFNGWQCDWWSTMHYKGMLFDVGGCAWNANIGINRNDEDFEKICEQFDKDELSTAKKLIKSK